MVSHLDLPYARLANITEKEPLNFCTLKLPNSKAASSRDSVADPMTTSFDEAKSGKWGTCATSGPFMKRCETSHAALKDSSFAKWEVTALPQHCTLAEALNSVAENNAKEERVLKYKIRFRDASELTFSRQRPERPETLAYSNYYHPAAAAAQQQRKAASPPRRRHDSPTDANGRARFLVTSDGRSAHHPLQGGRLPRLQQAAGSSGSGGGGSGTGFPVHVGPSGTLNFPNHEERRRLFGILDPNGNGKLSLAELDRGVVMLWPTMNNKAAVMRSYKAADANGTGLLGPNEFKAFLKYLHYYNGVWNKFCKVDKSRDKRVTLEELKAGCGTLGLTIAEVEAAFERMDSNRGGFVLFDEFAMYLAKQRYGGVLAGDDALLRRAASNRVSYKPHSSRYSAVSSRSSVSGGSTGSGNGSLYSRQQPPLVLPPTKDVNELFKSIDPNGNGWLSLAELDKAVVTLWPEFNHKPAIMRAYRAADTSGNGWLGRNEFKSFLKHLVTYNELWRTFQKIDRSNDRRITLKELVCVVLLYSLPFSALCVLQYSRVMHVQEAALPHIKGLSTVDAVQAFKKMDRNDV